MTMRHVPHHLQPCPCHHAHMLTHVESSSILLCLSMLLDFTYVSMILHKSAGPSIAGNLVISHFQRCND